MTIYELNIHDRADADNVQSHSYGFFATEDAVMRKLASLPLVTLERGTATDMGGNTNCWYDTSGTLPFAVWQMEAIEVQE